MYFNWFNISRDDLFRSYINIWIKEQNPKMPQLKQFKKTPCQTLTEWSQAILNDSFYHYRSAIPVFLLPFNKHHTDTHLMQSYVMDLHRKVDLCTVNLLRCERTGQLWTHLLLNRIKRKTAAQHQLIVSPKHSYIGWLIHFTKMFKNKLLVWDPFNILNLFLLVFEWL